MHAKRMDNFEQLYQDDDEDAIYLCHDCNSVITGEDNFDKHQCKERITCPGCYDIFHTPEDYADHTCANERRSQLDDESPTKRAKDIITCPGCNKVFNTLDDYADHLCTSRQHSTKKTQDKIACRACYKAFNTSDYADHRCTKPPAHVGKGKYMLLIGKYMLLTLLKSGKYMLVKSE